MLHTLTKNQYLQQTSYPVTPVNHSEIFSLRILPHGIYVSIRRIAKATRFRYTLRNLQGVELFTSRRLPLAVILRT